MQGTRWSSYDSLQVHNKNTINFSICAAEASATLHYQMLMQYSLQKTARIDTSWAIGQMTPIST